MEKVFQKRNIIKKKLSLLIILSFFLLPSYLKSQEKIEFAQELTGDQLYQEGLKLIEQEKYEEAISYFNEAAKRKPNFAEACYQLACCYIKLIDIENARQYLILAKYLGDENLKKEASSLLEKLPEVIEKEKKKLEEEKKKQEEEKKKQEEERRRQEEERRRQEEIKRKIEEERRKQMALKEKEEKEKKYYEQGITFYNQGEYKQAISNFTEVIKLEGDFAGSAYYHLGLCYIKLSDFEKASQSFYLALTHFTDETFKQQAASMLLKLSGEIEEVYEELSKKIPPKSEFETTEEYKKRVQSIGSTRIYAFKSDLLPTDVGFSIDYNADEQVLTIEILLEGGFYSRFGRKGLRVKRNLLEISTYTATNAFGAAVQVKKYTTEEYVIAPVNDIRIEKEPWNIAFLFTRKFILSPKEAKELLQNKENFELWIICRPCVYLSDNEIQPITFEDFAYIEPTFDSPREYSSALKCINAEVLQLWLYNPITGKRISLYPK